MLATELNSHIEGRVSRFDNAGFQIRDGRSLFCSVGIICETVLDFGTRTLQGGWSPPRRPRFRLFLTEILFCLPHSAWAGGNQAEWADHLGSNGGNNQI